MPTLSIDGQTVSVGEGATILDAARAAGVQIPTLCHRAGHDSNTSCLVCVVKVGGAARLVPSCATRAADGLVVESESADVRSARRMALELLLADHAGDCLGPCQNVCPAHMDIPAMLGHIAAGDLERAIAVVKERIALPAVLGRICPDLCESGCRRAARDEAVSICALKRHVADTDLAQPSPYVPPVAAASGKSVVVVGAGPAGLAAAYHLALLGHAVTLRHAHSLVGGSLRNVDPALLPPEVIDAEFATILAAGVKHAPGAPIELPAEFESMCAGHDAVLLAFGTQGAKLAGALGLAQTGGLLARDAATRRVVASGDAPAASARAAIFATGACTAVCKHAVKAVGDGRETAEAIDRHLRGLEAPPEPLKVRLGKIDAAELNMLCDGFAPAPRAAGEVLDDAAARAEAARCLQCACAGQHDCALRHWSTQYEADPRRFAMPRRKVEIQHGEGGVAYDSGKCIACGLCVSITSSDERPPGLTFVGRGFAIRIAVPFDAPLSEALAATAQKVVAACPTAALFFSNPHCPLRPGETRTP